MTQPAIDALLDAHDADGRARLELARLRILVILLQMSYDRALDALVAVDQAYRTMPLAAWDAARGALREHRA